MFYKNLVREMYIMLSVSKKCNTQIDVDEIIKQEIGVEWNDLLLVLFGIYMNSFLSFSVNDTINHLSFGAGKNGKEIFDKVVKYYSATYEDIRNSKFGRQVFYSKPFIITEDSDVVCFSIFSNQFITKHAIFWAVRNYYYHQDKLDFTSEFGSWFESYFKEMCNAFSIELERIEECGEERADWKIDTGKFIILIEQKSTIIRQSVKQQLTDFKAYKETVFKTIVKAMSQLKTTEQAYGIDHAFKFVLCYDDYFDDNLMQYVFDDDKCSIENDGRYFLINITEMEMLMDL